MPLHFILLLLSNSSILLFHPDAIREALAKFRATLNRRENDGDHQDEQHRRPGEDLELDEAEMQLRQQLQAAWDSLRGKYWDVTPTNWNVIIQ
jgi:hypothetical protein